MTRTKGGPPPAWTYWLYTIHVWTEDECTRNHEGHEGWRDAWSRLWPHLPVPRDLRMADEEWDGGDVTYYMWRRPGVVLMTAFDGAELRMTVDGHAKWRAAQDGYRDSIAGLRAQVNKLTSRVQELEDEVHTRVNELEAEVRQLKP